MYTYYTKKRQDTQHGFTLVETLVAISILLVVIIGPMTIAQRSMQSSFFANQQTTAVFLAQEAIESVQKLRDDAGLIEFNDYTLNGNNGSGDTWDWYTALNADCKNATGCDFHREDSSYKSCSLASNCSLKINLSNAKYVYGYGVAGWTATPYTRKIFVTDVGGDKSKVSVKVVVSWDTNLFSSGGSRDVTLQTWIYNQYKRFE